MQSSAYYATMCGHGFPSDGQIITTPIKAGLSHSVGFDVYVALTMRDYADENRTTLAGRYDITVYCINRLTQESYGEFTGSLEFTSATAYQAIGAAKPVGPPPPPRVMADDGSALALDPEPPPTGLPPAPGQPAPASVHQAPSAEPQVPSPAKQLASQRDDVTVPVVPWLVPVLAGAVLAALVAVGVAIQIRKRLSS